MPTSRRDFLRLSAGMSGALGAGLIRPWPARPTRPVAKANRAMRLLILGGTGFIGPHQVRYALERGHTVTLFNRGRTNPGLFPTVEHLGGDRNDNLSALEGREWDAVIDNSASVPRWVRQSAGLLKDSVRQYLFVSSISVFSDFSIVGLDENGPLHALEDPTVEQVTGETYGGMKALCEWEAEQALPGRATVVRPGLIAGPGDPTNRFTYWPVRIDEGGEVMAPGEHGDPVQFIDARDLSEWMVRLAEDEHVGIYNATGPGTPLSMAEMLYGIRAATASPVTFTWVDAEFLQQQDVRPWQHMTVWFPPRGEMAGFASVNCSKAIADGLTFRPLAVTAGDTMHWYKGLPDDHRARHTQFGLPREREREVLAAWHARGR